MTSIAPLFFVAAAIYAALCDHAERRVCNRTNIAIFVGGVLAAAVGASPLSVAAALLGTFVGLAVLFVPFARSWVGGGDIKFLAAVGAWLGPLGIAAAAAIGLAAAGLWALALVARCRHLRGEVASNLRIAALTLSDPGVPRRQNREVIPLVIPLAVAAVAVFLIGAPR